MAVSATPLHDAVVRGRRIALVPSGGANLLLKCRTGPAGGCVLRKPGRVRHGFQG